MGRPESILWLLSHELRLDMRRRADAGARRRGMAIATGIGAPLFLAAFVGVPLGLTLRESNRTFGPAVHLIVTAALASGFMMMLSQALAATVDALYERSDLDLLFSSPVPPLRVVSVRALAIAFSAFTIFGFLAVGPLVVIALMGRPAWLAALPVLFGTALAATGVALLLSLTLIRLFGPRRTRFIGHMLSVVVGSAFFLATQIAALAEPAQHQWPALRVPPAVAQSPLLSLGLQAMSGQPGAFVLVMAAQLVIFALGVVAGGPRFAALYAAAAGASVGQPRSNAAERPRRFAQGAFGAGLRKELRLLWRDPTLAPQILLRVVYLAPLGLLVVRYGADADLTALPATVMALTLMTHQLAGSLAWITVSAEDAPELLASAPASEPPLIRAKLAAAALIVAAVVAPVGLALLPFDPLNALVALGGFAAATASASLFNVWWRRPGKRTAFRERASAPLQVTVAELALGLLIAGAAGLLAARQILSLAPAAAALAVLISIRPRPKRERARP